MAVEGTLTVSFAMHMVGFSDEKCKDKSLQKRVTRARDKLAVHPNSSVPSSVDDSSSQVSSVSDLSTPSFNTPSSTSLVGFGKKLPGKMRHTGIQAHQIRKSAAEIKQHTIIHFKEACMLYQREVDLQKEAEAQDKVYTKKVATQIVDEINQKENTTISVRTV